MNKASLLTQAFLTASLFAATASAAPETYVIDNSHTYPRFEYTHLGFSNQVHRFNTTTGKVVLDRATKSGSVDVVIDATSVDTGHTAFNSHIQAEGFFDTAKFPTITYKSSVLKFDGDKLVATDGTLTINGVSKPVTLAVTGFVCKPHPFNKKEVCGANASAKIKRTEFNAGKYAPAVSDDVALTISIEAVKE